MVTHGHGRRTPILTVEVARIEVESPTQAGIFLVFEPEGLKPAVEESMNACLAKLYRKCWYLENEMKLVIRKRQAEKPREAEAKKYKNLESLLPERAIGQHKAVVAVSSTLHRARLNLQGSARFG